jgi:hypothetical protein
VAGHKAPLNNYSYISIEEKGRNGLQFYTGDIAFSELEVVAITPANRDYKYDSSIKETSLTVRERSTGKELFVRMNEAIGSGELIARPAQRLWPDAKFLSDELLLAFRHRISKQPFSDDEILFFISLRDKELYKKCSGDEFEFNAVRAEYLGLLNDLMNNFDLTATYYIDNQLTIGKYDFSKNGYPIEFTRTESGIMKYGDYHFAVPAYKSFGLIPVTSEYGQEVNKRRQGKGSMVGDTAYGRFYLRPFDKSANVSSMDLFLVNRDMLIGADLIGIEVYEFRQCDYNYIGSLKK